MIEFLVRLVFGIVVDLAAAGLAMFTSQYTGIDFFESLDYWNWFFVTLTVAFLMWPVSFTIIMSND